MNLFTNPRLTLFVCTLVLLTQHLAVAQDFDSYESYDSIVNELSSSSYTASQASTKDSFETIRFHVGVGLVTSTTKISTPLPTTAKDVDLQGFEARFGIDLFTPHWVAESAVRSYNPESYASGEVHLREFDLLVLYHTSAGRPFDFNIGGGMTARYLTFNNITSRENFARDNTTPSSVFTLGVDFGLTRAFSLGAQISYRNPFVNETADKGSIDGGVQLTGHL